MSTETKFRTPRAVTLSVLVVAVATLLGSLVLVVSTPAAAETPAERCARETSAYNSAWASSWAASNGRPVSEAPAPPVPYVCHDPGMPTTTSPVPSVTAPTVPTATDTPGGGVQPTVHAPTDIPAPGESPIVGTSEARPEPTRNVDRQGSPRNADIGRQDADYGGITEKPKGLTEKIKQLGENERRTCMTNPYDCNRSRDAQDNEQAKSESVKYFPGMGPESTKQDAARHCIWQGLTTESATSGFAEAMGNAHEKDWPSDLPGSDDMDQHNNVVGRSIGLRHEGDRVAIIRSCVEAARSAQKWKPNSPITAPSGSLIYILDK